jgi:hypothetical protein
MVQTRAGVSSRYAAEVPKTEPGAEQRRDSALHGPSSDKARRRFAGTDPDQRFAALADLSSTSRTDFRVASTVPPSGFNLLGCPERRRKEANERVTDVQPAFPQSAGKASREPFPAEVQRSQQDRTGPPDEAARDGHGSRSKPARFRTDPQRPPRIPQRGRHETPLPAESGSEPVRGGGGVTAAHGGCDGCRYGPGQRESTSRSRA